MRIDPVLLTLPFEGRWQARNSPARRVPSHGTELFGTTYAIDFVPVDDRGRSAAISWRTLLATEPAEGFTGFGRTVRAPARGVVVSVHDGEEDHVARRSPVAGLPYLLGQRARAGAGVTAIAGNHVVIALGAAGPYVLLAHLQRGSVRVAAGQSVSRGDAIGSCGNSGNSTQPHVHVQVTDSTRWDAAHGLPLAFTDYRVSGTTRDVPCGVPAEGQIVEPGPRA
ncbi:M23 family metallopeptidase [Propionicicella superfundia]|uniref:M23 family metallopeptidase n=1 Tax=Propionicicella superfundia TaxID=348582 RepID=UPI000407905A|nr:M23 family metallopeptidase [Propionicicella superfundia]